MLCSAAGLRFMIAPPAEVGLDVGVVRRHQGDDRLA